MLINNTNYFKFNSVLLILILFVTVLIFYNI